MRKTFTITISTNAITSEVLAVAALNNIMDNNIGDKISILTPDQKPALVRQTQASLGNILLHLLPHVASCNINDQLPTDGSEHLFNIEVYLNPDATSNDIITLRHSIEHTIALDTLCVCYMEHDKAMSDRYQALATAALNDICRLIDNTSGPNSVRVMNWI